MIFSKKLKESTNAKTMPIQNDRRFIMNNNLPFSIIEEYKALRTNIIFSLPGERCKVVGITSANAQEGKSINSLNIAITFSQTNARVLLIDCDLRLPKIGRLLDMNTIPGMSNVLIGMNKVSEVVRETNYDGLNVILSGNIPPNPSELLSSDRMEQIIDELKSDYDYIIIDLPPINVVSDAAVVCKCLSGIILIVRSGWSKREDAVKAINQLEFVHANVLGIVMNFAEVNGGGEKYKRSKYGYQKYYKSYKNYNQYACTQSNMSYTYSDGAKKSKESLKTGDITK